MKLENTTTCNLIEIQVNAISHFPLKIRLELIDARCSSQPGQVTKRDGDEQFSTVQMFTTCNPLIKLLHTSTYH